MAKYPEPESSNWLVALSSLFFTIHRKANWLLRSARFIVSLTALKRVFLSTQLLALSYVFACLYH
ncbi:hypothetical protein P4S68_17630 [Pseudoalteromonas sp. Hal099]